MHKLNIQKIIDNLIKPSESLSRRVVVGGFWVFTLRILQRVFNLIRLIVLARILVPHDFGLMGIALLTMAILETFSQTGFKQALIQKKDNIERYLNAAWTVLILRGFILFAILYLIAPYAAIFFNAPEAKPIIQVIGLSFLLQASINIGVVYFQKELEFNKQFIYQLAGTLADFIVAISSVLILRNVWALVLGLLAGNMARFIVSYLIHPCRPHLSLDLGEVKELFGFGRWILGSSIIIFLAAQGDDIFLGKILGATALGFYQMAFRIGNMPSSEFAGMIGKVAFPAYSKLQTSPQKLREAYLRIITFSTFLSIPLGGGIVVLAPQFTQIFLGEKWLPIVVPLQILVISGVFRSIAGTGGAMFKAIGKPKLDFKMNVTRLVVIVLSIYPLTMMWKISGTSLSVLLGIVAACFIWLHASIKETKTNGRDYLLVILPPILGTLLMCGVIMGILKTATFINNQLLVFFISVITGILAYFGTMFLIGKKSRYNGLHEINFILKNLWRGSV